MIWILLIIFQLKHFIADYLLQGKYMLGKFKSSEWVLPLASHCAVHFIFTTLIALVFVSLHEALLLGLLDFILHFIMDRIKASPNMLGKYKSMSAYEMKSALNMAAGKSIIDGTELPKHLDQNLIKEYKELGKKDIKNNMYFWWSLGLDQMIHHLTDILIIYLIIEVL